MATTRSRSRQRSAEIKRSSLSLSIISRMASTWPCGRDFCVVNRSCGETRGSSRSTRRKVSILSGGQSERLATVRLRVFWPSRQASRRRTAGGELRLGTTSMYMGALDHNTYTLSSIYMINYMGAYWRSRDGTMHTFPAVYPRIQPLLLLELRSRGLQKRLLHGSDCLTILLLGAICRYARCRNDPRKSRVHQRDSRLAHLEDRGPRSEPRLRDRATPATNIERLLSGPSGLALPRASPT